MKELQTFVKNIYATSSKNEAQISRLGDMKVESKEFYETKDDLVE